ncbi:MAG: TIGR03618 family F420-dependent PPOX class oxidoreductase [Dehalococcoidia bacterium]|nr:TIGR03618 family F420-dependent PPOX class oxidoreductase [Dehalococcoidia bacterium]
MASMSREQRDAFLREVRIAKLATLTAGGAPTVVPVWFEWDGVTARVFSSRSVQKVRNIQRDNRVALTVEEAVGVPEAWVTIEGTAAILDEGGFELASRLAPRYYGEPKASETLKQWARAGDAYWVLIEITPTRIRSSAP